MNTLKINEGVQTSDNQVVLGADLITKRFGDIDVLRGISLQAKRGDVISLIGASGSGKSTFLRCLNFLEVPTTGTVLIRGEAFTNSDALNRTRQNKRKLRRLRREVGMVFQSFNLWPHMTAVENVMEGPVQVLKDLPKQARSRALDLLARVGLAERADYRPSQLSGGQQQRVAIARALAMNPDVLLFDEPTSALDPELVGEVLAVMTDLAKEGRTMLIVTHEIGFARDVSNKMVFLSKGQIEEEGPPGSLIESPKSEDLARFLARMRH
ncbi:amino acid ABC transporter ATP-binding protein [Sinorhizobium meliloti]|uniref:amino acid ABC transporter ATP-binding protein n=1 Tax=Rhizobium meliloti TaxID=382 RepID=UPI000B49EF7B|nr:amino acid ABC transporter ATP-binding protein [Sinorhizobium meliloti]ASP69709.1 amino acid ABC transporter ATP-binding protein [Sinorhizobium meliloti]MQX04412.1 ATP-binding cassette domain-containing protein [Sinorhizobium meliloti]RVK40855.1 amino acid ABC transporter ATP-binding protein [Sinorhizobium meliloti]